MSASERLDAAIAADRSEWGIESPPFARTWTIDGEGARPLTVNRVAELHRQQWAKHTKVIRRVWAIYARQYRIPHLDAVSIVATPLHANNRSPQDVGACAPEVKAAIDGLVDAGVLDDDGPAFVRSLLFLPPLVSGADGLRLTITEEL